MVIKSKIRNFIFSCGVLCVHQFTVAQQTLIYSDPERFYKNGYELYIKEKYSAAIEEFEKTLKHPEGVSNSFLVDALFYSAVSSAELFNKDAEFKLRNFMEQYPNSSKSKLAAWHLGKWYFKQKQYRKAAEYFTKSDVLLLSSDDVSEFYFKSGYSYFMANDLVKANQQFQQIIHVDSKYQTAANFYYAHIAFSNKNYETALKSFDKLNESEAFGPFATYYITQIYFQQDKYDEVIKYAPTALQKPNIQNANEVRRILAESYFRTADYKNASKVYAEYKVTTPNLNRDDLYKLGYSQYQSMEYEKAIDNLQKVVNMEDTLSQNAYYHLADCFLKSNNKQSARNAFQFASKNNFNTDIKEDALFNYGKLSFELGFQSAGINAFRDYAKSYPGTNKTDKANEYLAQLYLSTKNYKDALVALESISNKSADAKRAFQKVAYYRAIELYNDRDFPKAIVLFEKAIVTNPDQIISAQAIYWKAEALYKQQKYDAAVKQYRTFIFYPAAINLENFNQANYDLGYCHFKLENYSEAEIWFRKYLKDEAHTDAYRKSDAMVRLGDSYFMTKNYDNAGSFYNDAIKSKTASADYCYFQMGMIAGLQNNLERKIEAMNNIQQNYSKSNYLDDATFEKGKALSEKGDESNALIQFQKVITDFPQSNFVTQAQLKSALIYFSKGNNDKAEETFMKVINTNPKSIEATEALNGLKNIYVKEGQPDKLKEVYDKLPLPKLSEGAQDSIFYEAAELSLQSEDYKKAGDAFAAYLEKFPNGSFSLNATFYKAECDLKQKNYADALIGYEKVLTNSKNNFSEKSLYRAAGLNYVNMNYEKALDQYQRLEQIADFMDNIIASLAGQMRCNYQLKNYDAVITNVQKLYANNKVSKELLSEAHWYMGKAALAKDDLATARIEFKETEKISGERGAESKYSLAYILYREKKYKESQKKSFEVINQVPSYDFWVAKSFILLADNYMALEDTFQTKSTLKSIIDNYEKNSSDPEDILQIANEKYDAIISHENKIFRKEDVEMKLENDSIK